MIWQKILRLIKNHIPTVTRPMRMRITAATAEKTAVKTVRRMERTAARITRRIAGKTALTVQTANNRL